MGGGRFEGVSRRGGFGRVGCFEDGVCVDEVCVGEVDDEICVGEDDDEVDELEECLWKRRE
jgi:hypothetical protein